MHSIPGNKKTNPTTFIMDNYRYVVNLLPLMVMVMSMHSQPCRDYSADTNELVCWMKGHILTFPKTWCTSGFHDIWVKQHRPGNRNITYSLWSLCFFSFTFICSLAQSSRITVQPLEHIPFFIHMNILVVCGIQPCFSAQFGIGIEYSRNLMLR